MKGMTIPEGARLDLCEHALAVSKASNDLFDAIEAGDLVAAVLAHGQVLDHAQALSINLKALAGLRLAEMRAAGIPVGGRR